MARARMTVAVATYRGLDHTFSLDAPPPIDAIAACALAGLVVSPTPDDDVHMITVTRTGAGGWSVGDRPWISVPLGRAVAELLENINRAAADSVTSELPLHGATVGHEGRYIALIGPSGSGKSTLAAAAVRAGWTFVAEEVSAVDPVARMVRSFHRPIGLRDAGATAIGVPIPSEPDGRWDEVFPWLPPESSRRHEGVLAGAVLLRRAGAAPTPTELRPAEALVALVENSVVPSDDRVPGAFRRAEQLARTIPVVRLSIGSADDGVSALHDLLRRWP